MTALAFILAFIAAAIYFAVAGPFIWHGGPTIYTAAIWLVMASAAFYSARAALRRKDNAYLWSCAILCGIVVYGWQIGWIYGPPGLLHGAVYSLVGACFLAIGARRFQHIIGGVLLALSVASFMNVLGVFPKRPRVFTGFYYPDLMAYGMHLNFIIIGASAGDGLRDIISRVWRGRGYSHRVLVWAAHRRQSQKVVP